MELVGGGGDLVERAAVAAAAAVSLAEGVEEDAVPIPYEIHVVCCVLGGVWKEVWKEEEQRVWCSLVCLRDLCVCRSYFLRASSSAFT